MRLGQGVSAVVTAREYMKRMERGTETNIRMYFIRLSKQIEIQNKSISITTTFKAFIQHQHNLSENSGHGTTSYFFSMESYSICRHFFHDNYRIQWRHLFETFFEHIHCCSKSGHFTASILKLELKL